MRYTQFDMGILLREGVFEHSVNLFTEEGRILGWLVFLIFHFSSIKLSAVPDIQSHMT